MPLLEPSRSSARRLLLVVALSTLGCGGAAELGPPAVTLIAPPERTAAEDTHLRSLLVAMAERQMCRQVLGQFVALPDADSPMGPASGASPSAGRLWIQGCTAERQGDRLAMRLEGSGWTWIEQTNEGPMGTSFTVRGHLRFRSEFDLEGAVDVAYVEGEGLVSLWLTPAEGVEARIVPTGAVPVAPNGGWSRFLAGVGDVFGASAEERARPMVEEQGSTLLRETLGNGFTFTLDVCRGQPDSMVGALGNGERPERPYPPDEQRWLANQRVRLRPGGLDIAGSFDVGDAPLHIDLEVEEGPGVEVSLFCEGDAGHIARAFLDGESIARTVTPLATTRVGPRTATFIEADTRQCPVAMVVTPIGAETSVFRYRVFGVGDAAEPLVACDR